MANETLTTAQKIIIKGAQKRDRYQTRNLNIAEKTKTKLTELGYITSESLVVKGSPEYKALVEEIQTLGFQIIHSIEMYRFLTAQKQSQELQYTLKKINKEITVLTDKGIHF